MFGRNTVLKPIFKEQDGSTLIVNSIWPTIQGEGPLAGTPAIFIRLTGCNLRCHFCDTEFEKGGEMLMGTIVKRVIDLIEHGDGLQPPCQTDLVVITGGEPMRQQIIPLLQRLSDLGLTIQIETAGTVWPPSVVVQRTMVDGSSLGAPIVRHLEDLIHSGDVKLVCSPKTPGVHPNIERYCEHFKYIIRKGETDKRGLPCFSTQIPGEVAELYQPDGENVIPTIWLQPMTEYTRDLITQTENVDFGATRDNHKEVARLAMKHGHQVSLQTHRILEVE